MRNPYLLRWLTSLALLLCGWPRPVAAAPFTPGNIVVARVGDGTAPLNGDATAVFLVEYTPTGTLVQTIALPTSVTGNNRILTASGVATSELNLTRSADGRYLVLTGYGAAPGTSAVAGTASTDVARVIGRIAADGTFDTRTSLGEAFSGGSVRAAASADGQGFYAVGANSAVHYVAFGGFAGVQLNTAPTNIRAVNVSNGKLYVSASSSPYIGLSQVGTGLPTAAGQTATILPGFPGTVAGSSPYGFYFADLSTDVAGVDVVYVADDRTSATTGGVQKWSLVGGTWVLNGTIGGSSTAALRGLNGQTVGTSVSLAAAGNGGLYVFADNAGYNAAPSPDALPSARVTAPASTAFRGAAFAPVIPSPTIVSFSPASGQVGTTVTVTGNDMTGATGVTLNGAAVMGFTVVSATSLTFVVPAGATSGLIAVTTPSGTATSATAFTVIAPNPVATITSLSPSTAVASSAAFTLTVNGTNFLAASAVNFNGVALATTFVSATQLTAAVPASALATAGSFPVTVTNPAPGGGTSAGVTFTVTVPAPTIVSFTPTTGGPGTAVTITGTNFTGTTAVAIGSFAVTNFTVVSATSITLVVPSGTGSVSGFITVTTPGRTATSAATFNLVSATLASNALPELMVYPNPTTDRITVELPRSGAVVVAMRDLMGRMVLAPAPLAANRQVLLPAELATGVYLLEVRQGTTVAVRRIEKR